MDVFEAIRTRRSISAVDPDRPVPRETIEELVELATWAPNHHLTEPWRFHVIAGEARGRLGEALHAALVAQGDAPPARIASAREKPLRAPVIVVVTAKAGKDAVTTRENEYATAAAVQILLLGAHARGLGAIWRTGRAAYSPELAAHLGLEEGERVIGLVYVGFTTAEREGKRRLSASDCTIWRGWD